MNQRTNSLPPSNPTPLRHAVCVVRTVLILTVAVYVLISWSHAA
ncbi:MAG: hypothetical protein AAGA96_09385 [Verrucomicrobiota bacterium]